MAIKKLNSKDNEGMNGFSIHNSRFKQVMEELKFIHSPKDIKIQSDKIIFILNRWINPAGLFDKRPLSLQLEPTNFCNVDCICCSSPAGFRYHV